jgi:hypothetical protein
VHVQVDHRFILLDSRFASIPDSRDRLRISRRCKRWTIADHAGESLLSLLVAPLASHAQEREDL